MFMKGIKFESDAFHTIILRASNQSRLQAKIINNKLIVDNEQKDYFFLIYKINKNRWIDELESIEKYIVYRDKLIERVGYII